jgi:hypothetical protein
MSARPLALSHSELMAQHKDLDVLPPPLRRDKHFVTKTPCRTQGNNAILHRTPALARLQELDIAGRASRPRWAGRHRPYWAMCAPGSNSRTYTTLSFQ